MNSRFACASFVGHHCARGRRSKRSAAAACSVVLVCAGLATPANAQSGMPQYELLRIGLYDAEHTSASRAQSSSVEPLSSTNSGSLFYGSASSYNRVSGQTGRSTWIFRPDLSLTVRTGLRGPVFDQFGPHESINTLQNTLGVTAGQTRLYRNDNVQNGQAAWVYSPQSNQTVRVGLFGDGFVGDRGFSQSQARLINATNLVVGSSNRYLGTNTPNGFGAWVFDSNTGVTRQIGFTSNEHTGSQKLQWSQADFVSNSGIVAGFSRRYLDLNTSNGADTWAYNHALNQTFQTGLITPEYVGTNGLRFSSNHSMSLSGQIAGSSSRYEGQINPTGFATWVYSPTLNQTIRTGFFGGQFTSSTGAEESQIRFHSLNGFVAGTSRIYTGTSPTGIAAWVYSPSLNQSTRAGFWTGSYVGNNGPQSDFTHSSPTGVFAGVSISQFGDHTWAFNPETNQTYRTGLRGGDFTSPEGLESSENRYVSNRGFVGGISNSFVNGLSRASGGAWVYSPLTNLTTRIGLVDAEHTDQSGFQSSWIEGVLSNGLFHGGSRRDSDTRRSNWIYNPNTGNTIRIGLVAPENTSSIGERQTSIEYSSASGFVAGHSGRYVGALPIVNQASWIYNPFTEQVSQIGLTSPAYVSTTGAMYSSVRGINDAGQAIGFSYRYLADGTAARDPWFYSPVTGTSVNLFSGVASVIRSSDGYSYALPTVITPDGFVLGTYSVFANGTGPEQTRAFIWHSLFGFSDLNDVIVGGLSSQDIALVTAFSQISNGNYILAFAQPSPGGAAIITLRQIPTPTAAALLALGALTASRRRRA